MPQWQRDEKMTSSSLQVNGVSSVSGNGAGRGRAGGVGCGTGKAGAVVKKLRLAMMAAVLSSACGCTQLVSVYSQPAGAKCYINDEYRGETPVTTHVTSWALRPSPTIRLEKEGFDAYEAPMRKRFQDDYVTIDLLNLWDWLLLQYRPGARRLRLFAHRRRQRLERGVPALAALEGCDLAGATAHRSTEGAEALEKGPVDA
jgi:hypothetical protein